MTSEAQQEPRQLVLMSGFIIGMSVEDGRSFGREARVQAESSVGPVAAVAVQWAVFLGWMLAMVVLVRWFARRQWVRDWFAAAENMRSERA